MDSLMTQRPKCGLLLTLSLCLVRYVTPPGAKTVISISLYCLYFYVLIDLFLYAVYIYCYYCTTLVMLAAELKISRGNTLPVIYSNIVAPC